MILAYVGAEVVMPIASAGAAILGVILIGWRWILSKSKAVYRFVLRKPAPEPDETLIPEDPAQVSEEGS